MKTMKQKSSSQLWSARTLVLALLMAAIAVALVAGPASATVFGQIKILKVDPSGAIINLPGASFNISPTVYYGAQDLMVVDNDVNDHDLAYGIILLYPCYPGPYTITELTAPGGYQVDPTPQTMTVDFTIQPLFTFTFVNTPTDNGEGYTPGFWKNHTELWDGIGTNDVTSIIKTTTLFNATLGVTSAQSGLADTFTLLQGVNLRGGGLMALNRHVSAALVNADAGINYGYSLAEVISLYRDAVGADAGAETVATALAKLVAANQMEGSGF